MVFSSNIFLFLFLPVTLALYYAIRDHRWRNSVLVVMSILFYAWGAPGFLPVFFVSLLTNYFLVLAIEKTSVQSRRKLFLAMTVVFNLAILVYFKYTNFLAREFNHLLTVLGLTTWVWSQVLLPLGISFFTFHMISYAVDVYRHRQKGFTNLLDYNLYLLFFPQLIAGPIIRFHEIADQIREREHTRELFLEGIWRFALGLSKKVVIADPLGNVANSVFSISPTQLDTPSAWLGLLCCTFQLYFDFSGYSDMAIGMGRMFGFRFPENFNRPYLSRSITEFWQRWHMSLTRFFKDYVYIPLGGNRVSLGRQYVNLWIVFLLCGLWHGANWTFFVFGIYYGTILICERVILLKKLEIIPPVLRTIYAFGLTVMGMTLFRSPDIFFAFHYFKKLFLFDGSHHFLSSLNLNIQFVFIFLLAAVACFLPVKAESAVAARWRQSILFRSSVGMLMLVYSILVLSRGSFSPFIYFQF